MKNILLVGAKPKPITGQSEAFRYVCEDSGFWSVNKVHILYNNKGDGVLAYFYFFYFFVKVTLFILFQRYNTVYLTISRSKIGFFKDFPILLLNLVFPMRLVVHLHGADFLLFRNSLNKLCLPFFDFLYSRVSVAIVLTKGMKEQFDIYPKVKVEVVSNSAPSKLLKIKPPFFDGKLKILYLSNLMASKGVLNLSLAVEELLNDEFDIELILAGKYISDDVMNDKDLIYEVDRVIQASRGRISYLGVVTGKKKDDLFGWSNVVALPSQYATEAQPLILIEGMMSGRYLLSTNHNYISDTVEHLVNGYLTENNSVDQIKKALLYFYKKPQSLISLGCENKLFANAEYSMKKYLSSIKNIMGL